MNYLPLKTAATLLLVTAGCQENAAPLTSTRVVPVRAVAVSPLELQRTTVQPASVHAYYEAKIRGRVSGYISQVNADIGDYVQAGDVLAVIDMPELDMQRNILEAKLQRARAEVSRAEAGVALARANVAAAQARVEQNLAQKQGAEANLAAAEAEFARVQDLINRNSLEPRKLDEVRQRRDAEKANQLAVDAAIASAEADVAVAEAKLAAAQSDVQAVKLDAVIAQGQLDELLTLLGFTSLRVPLSGVVTERNVDPGDLVESAPAADPLFVVSQTDRVRIRISVPEAEAAVVKPGDAIELTLPSFQDEATITTTVSRISGNLDTGTRSMLVEADYNNEDRKLLPGMFGQATIALGEMAMTKALPARAIRFDETGKAYVYVLRNETTVPTSQTSADAISTETDSTDERVVQVVDVRTGADNGGTIEILSGLELGQTVVDAHLERFSDGQRVALVTQTVGK